MPTRPTIHLEPLETYPPNLRLWLERFAAGKYRAALDPIEACWFADRNTFYQGLIKLTVGMNQVETTSLVSGPCALLTSARALLQPYAPAHLGIDVDVARRVAANGLRRVARRERNAAA